MLRKLFLMLYNFYFPEIGWKVKANDRPYHNLPEFQKKVFLCVKKSKYSVSYLYIFKKLLPCLNAPLSWGLSWAGLAHPGQVCVLHVNWEPSLFCTHIFYWYCQIWDPKLPWHGLLTRLMWHTGLSVSPSFCPLNLILAGTRPKMWWNPSVSDIVAESVCVCSPTE